MTCHRGALTAAPTTSSTLCWTRTSAPEMLPWSSLPGRFSRRTAISPLRSSSGKIINFFYIIKDETVRIIDVCGLIVTSRHRPRASRCSADLLTFLFPTCPPTTTSYSRPTLALAPSTQSLSTMTVPSAVPKVVQFFLVSTRSTRPSISRYKHIIVSWFLNTTNCLYQQTEAEKYLDQHPSRRVGLSFHPWGPQRLGERF